MNADKTSEKAESGTSSVVKKSVEKPKKKLSLDISDLSEVLERKISP